MNLSPYVITYVMTGVISAAKQGLKTARQKMGWDETVTVWLFLARLVV